MENVVLLRSVIDGVSNSSSPKPTAFAWLDVRKAFDSVSHESLIKAAGRLGVPGPLLRYIAAIYRGGTTRLTQNGKKTDRITVGQGVRQGDLLSCWLFNACIDWAISHIDPCIGVKTRGGYLLTHLAFADDLVLFAENAVGLQLQLNAITEALGLMGLTLNAAKCPSVVISVVRKKSLPATTSVLNISGQPIPALLPSEFYKYLGVNFNSSGTEVQLKDKLNTFISNLTKQRLYALKTNVIPALFHQSVLASTTVKELKNLDVIIRAAVRDWTKLPKDTSLGYFYAALTDGGLGLTGLSNQVPSLKVKRLMSLARTEDLAIKSLFSLDFLQRQLRKWNSVLDTELGSLTGDSWDPARRTVYWRNFLHNACDGKGLSQATRAVSSRWPHPAIGHKWLTDGTTTMVLSWRGIFAPTSIADFLELGGSVQDLEFLARLCVSEGAHIYRFSENSTAHARLPG